MKNIILLYLISVSLSVWSAYAVDSNVNYTDMISNNIQMSISLDGRATQLKLGQSLGLLICFKNTSTNESFNIYEVNGTIDDSSYSFSIISPSGKNISPDMAKRSTPWSGAIHNVAPGHIYEIKFDMSKLCTLDEIGTYKIIAKKTGVWSSAKPITFEVISNPLNISVVNGE